MSYCAALVKLMLSIEHCNLRDRQIIVIFIVTQTYVKARNKIIMRMIGRSSHHCTNDNRKEIYLEIKTIKYLAL